MPKAFPLEFRRDVVAVARKDEAPIGQIRRTSESPRRVCSAGCSWPISRTAAGRVRPRQVGRAAGGQEAGPAVGTGNEILRRAAAYFARDINPK
jgi:transposase